MRKVIIHRPGGLERLVVEEQPDPTPGPGEVLVRVAAAGINYADCIIRMGLYASAKELHGYPITPGFEVAGQVAAVGEGVTRFAVGDRVLAVSLFGGYASRLVVPEHQVYACPSELELAEAAALPAVALTAHHALFELCKLRPGARVLVHSAGGGVGSMLVQMGKIAGAEVVGVVGGAHKVEHVRALGADHVIDKSSTPLWGEVERLAPGGLDVVLDANGVETLKQSYEHLRPTGRLVIYGFHSMLPKQGGRPDWLKLAWSWLRTPRFDPLKLTNDNRSVMAFNLSYLFERRELLEEGMERVLGWIHEGRLRLPEVTRYPVDRVADAHAALESGQTVGKLVLSFGD